MPRSMSIDGLRPEDRQPYVDGTAERWVRAPQSNHPRAKFMARGIPETRSCSVDSLCVHVSELPCSYRR